MTPVCCSPSPRLVPLRQQLAAALVPAKTEACVLGETSSKRVASAFSGKEPLTFSARLDHDYVYEAYVAYKRYALADKSAMERRSGDGPSRRRRRYRTAVRSPT